MPNPAFSPVSSDKPRLLLTRRQRLRRERLKELYATIRHTLAKERPYRHPDCNAKTMAQRLGISPRLLAEAISEWGKGENFAAMVTRYRLRLACQLLRDPRHAYTTSEEIALRSGFASRQSFYNSFRRAYDMTPGEYRESLQSPALP